MTNSITGDLENTKKHCRDLIKGIAAATPKQAEEMDKNPEIQSSVANLFIILSILLQGKPERQWTADLEHPGFLTLNTADEAIAAPFHLIADIPSGGAFNDIRAIARDLRLATESALCLSGSIVLLGDPRYVGDLDFCEYIPQQQRSPSLKRLATYLEQSDTLPICVKVKLGDQRQNRPWPRPVTYQELDAWLAPCPEGGHGKLDLLTLSSTTGPVEASNLLLWLPDSNPDDYAAKYSSPFQEIVTDTRENGRLPWIPRQLARPSNICRYVSFLRDEINHYRNENPIKALKRALSLATFLMLDNIQEKLIQLGLENQAFEREAINQRRALLDMVTTHPDPLVAAHASRLKLSFDAWASAPPPDWNSQYIETFSRHAEALVDELLAALLP